MDKWIKLGKIQRPEPVTIDLRTEFTQWCAEKFAEIFRKNLEELIMQFKKDNHDE